MTLSDLKEQITLRCQEYEAQILKLKTKPGSHPQREKIRAALRECEVVQGMLEEVVG